MYQEHQISYIGLGSNEGDRKDYLCQAIALLEQHPQIKLLKLSHFYQTEPLTLNQEIQKSYLNAVLEIRSHLNAVRLLQFLQEIENQLGRIRTHRWGPRTIDLDLLFFGNEIIRSKNLTVPHPELHRRRFVMEPLVEIAPQFIHPIKGKNMTQLLQGLTDNKKVKALYQFQLCHSSEGVIKTPYKERL